MEAIIAFDSHKRYTLASVETRDGKLIRQQRINHRQGSIKEFLLEFAAGCPVAVETVGNWYWITDEIEQAGMRPELVHARKAKLMMGSINKTDKLDGRVAQISLIFVASQIACAKIALCHGGQDYDGQTTRR
jgi:hypothetical protein